MSEKDMKSHVLVELVGVSGVSVSEAVASHTNHVFWNDDCFQNMSPFYK